MRSKAINIIKRAEMGEAPSYGIKAMKGVGVYANDVSEGKGINYFKRTLEDIAPQLRQWLEARRSLEAIKNRLAYIAEQERLRENGLDVNDAFRNLWPDVHTRLLRQGEEARSWLKESGDEGILGESK